MEHGRQYCHGPNVDDYHGWSRGHPKSTAPLPVLIAGSTVGQFLLTSHIDYNSIGRKSIRPDQYGARRPTPTTATATLIQNRLSGWNRKSSVSTNPPQRRKSGRPTGSIQAIPPLPNIATAYCLQPTRQVIARRPIAVSTFDHGHVAGSTETAEKPGVRRKTLISQHKPSTTPKAKPPKTIQYQAACIPVRYYYPNGQVDTPGRSLT